ncbi:hypothetical protein C0431_02060 [bacterium]|nr:hypothetical protein [bacterium]
MVIPVALRLQELGYEVVVLALTTAWGPVSRAGLQTIGFRDFLAGDESVLKLGRELAGTVEAHADVHPEETQAYLGLSYKCLEARLGVEGAREAYEQRGRQAFLPLEVLSRVFDEVQPDLILATNSPRAERAAVLVAKERHIPAVVVVDLMPQSEVEWLRDAGYGKAVCVLSEGVKQRLVDAGRPETEVVVTGNAAFDELFLMDEQTERAVWRKKFGFSEDERVLLFASQPDRYQYLGTTVGTQLVEVGKAHGWTVVVRPHPNEQFDPGGLPCGTPISDREDSLWGALAGCDACVVVSSSVGLQAAILGKPMVTLDVPVFADPAPYAAMGIGRVAETVEGVFEVLESQLAFGSFESGPATMRVVRVVESLLEGR